MPELVADVTSSINGAVGHTVRTIARVGGGAPGLMVATSQFRSANWVTGFKAAATVVLLDANQQILAVSSPFHGWADATWFGRSDNTSTWTFQFDPALANSAAGIALLHTPDENYIDNWAGFFAKYGNAIVAIIEAIAKVAGGSSQPYDADTETGGGGGGIGTTESESWALLGEPWRSYASTAPRTGVANATPNVFTGGIPASITVRAVDQSTGTAIDGVVFVGNSAVGRTGVPFTFTWNSTYRVRAAARAREPRLIPNPLPAMTVRAVGYVPMSVPVEVRPGVQLRAVV